MWGRNVFGVKFDPELNDLYTRVEYLRQMEQESIILLNFQYSTLLNFLLELRGCLKIGKDCAR